RAHLLGQVDGVAAHQWSEGTATAAEQVGAGRAVAGTAGALLAIDLLAGAVDLRPVLDLVSAALALGELPVDAALQDVGTRREAENGVGQRHRAGLLTVERGDRQLHVTPLPYRPQAALLQAARPQVARSHR